MRVQPGLVEPSVRNRAGRWPWRDLLLVLRHWLGPLGRYRPGWLRHDLSGGFQNCDRLRTPAWLRLAGASSSEERLLLALDLDGRTVYDIGAHAGAYSLHFSRRVGASGSVVAMEPHPFTFSKLTRNLRLNGIQNVRALPIAAGRMHDWAPIYMLPGMPSTASLACTARTPFRQRAGEAEIERLDVLVRELSLPRPDFIKVDVEGMEADVLSGASLTLRRWHPGLLVEMHGTDRHHRRENAKDVITHLTALGYTIEHIESGVMVQPETASLAATGHLFAWHGPEGLALAPRWRRQDLR